MNTAKHLTPFNHDRPLEYLEALSPKANAEVDSPPRLPDTIVTPDEATLQELPDASPPALIELILKDRSGLHRLLGEKSLHPALLPRFLAIALTGFVLFGIAMSLVLTVAERWPALTAVSTWLQQPDTPLLSFTTHAAEQSALTPWINGNVVRLVAGYTFGLIAASGVCLPSLYFYCLLAGIRLTMVEVVLHTVKATAVTAVALVGILPIYVALAMGAVIFHAPSWYVSAMLGLGLLLPFVAGLWGMSSLYDGFSRLADTLPSYYRGYRICFLNRLVLSWSACYTAVSPVMIYSVWEVLSR